MFNNLPEQLGKWIDEDNHKKIIETITKLDETELNYDLLMLLATAYTNTGEYEKALDILESLEDDGNNDCFYYFSLADAFFYLERFDEAIEALERSLELCPQEGEDSEVILTDILLKLCMCARYTEDEELFEKYSEYLKSIDEEAYKMYFEAPLPEEEYTPEEMDCIENFVEENIGEIANVFHEIVSPDIHVDILIVPPTEKRNFYSLVTMGMGSHKMNVPEELEDAEIDRAELIISLPSDWNVSSEEEKWYWPIRNLKQLARLPINEDSWLGWGHTVANGEPFAENTAFDGVILFDSPLIDDEAVCELPNGEKVTFYQVIPLYEDELDYKIQNDGESLLDLFTAKDVFSPVVDINRKNYCEFVHKKEYAIPRSMIEDILNFDGPAGCFATDRILVDGAKVGYMYREKPEDYEQDSGWRFMAGDEDQSYMDDPNNMGIYHLNTICNYDKDIIPLLNSPYGTAFARNKRGKFVKKKL